MKSIQTKSITQSIFAITAAVLILIYFSSCAKKISFQSSSVVPAARGDVKVKKDNNNNYNIQISVNNLAEPKRLQPSKTAYVVWMETDQNSVKNIGQIKSSKKLFSKALKASISTVTPHYPTKFFITAENNGDISYPEGETVLTTESF